MAARYGRNRRLIVHGIEGGQKALSRHGEDMGDAFRHQMFDQDLGACGHGEARVGDPDRPAQPPNYEHFAARYKKIGQLG